jgi:CMP-N-acetylneuraminic acid synthetase
VPPFPHDPPDARTAEAFAGHSVLAVVPARGGSRGIPRKNLCKVGGLSLVARAARVARELPFDCAVLSTDDEEIAAEGRRAGLSVPFLRPPEIAGDRATAIDTWRHAWLAAEAHEKRRFDWSVYLEPTSPLRRPDDVVRTLLALRKVGTLGAFTVSRNPGPMTPERTLCLDAEDRVRPFVPDGHSYTARQAIPPRYHRNGLAYAATRQGVIEAGDRLWDDCVAVVIDRPVANVDAPIDLEWAEFLLAREQ